MSTFAIRVTNIISLEPHDNADRLEIAKVYGWEVVVPKNVYKSGDFVIYVPVDAVLPKDLEDKIFGPDSKIKLHKHRIKSIRIRGRMSQGMLINMEDAVSYSSKLFSLVPEQDVSKELGITKYEPEVNELPKHMQVKKKKKAGNPNFKKYTDIENFKYYDRTFQENEQVYISEKLHGTSFRAGWFKSEANTFWKKVKKFFGKLPEWEFCYGSRTVEISAKPDYNGFYGTDIYGSIVNQYNLKDTIPMGMAVYGEIVGDGIQKNYTYGCKQGEHKLFVYDLMDTVEGRFLDYPQLSRECARLGLVKVPLLYLGVWDKAIADGLRDGDSTIGGQKCREGVVIRPVVERKTGSLNRVILKYISDAYYLQKDSTDFH